MIPDAVVTEIDGAVLAEMERSGQPGLALGLTDRQRTVAVRTYGRADLASGAPVKAETLFEIGSIGKSFTALAALQIVEESRLDLDAPVVRYLPWFEVPQPDGVSPIAVAHLLSHTAGIVAGIDGTPEAAFQVWSLRDVPAASAPGERFHYSNVGYKALGLVLEAIEERPYPEIVRARILEPLGMDATEPAITHEIRERLAVGYEYLHDDRIGHAAAPLAPAPWLETATADGSIASTVDDMCAFARVLLNEGGGLVSASSFTRMSTAHARSDFGAYGFGLVLRDVAGHRYVGHGGGMVGYLAGLQVDPRAGVGAVVLQNGYGANPMALARSAIRIACGGSVAAGETSVSDDVVGVYERDDGVRIEIVSAFDSLVLRFDDREVSLRQLDDDILFVPDPAFDRFTFRVDRAGGGVALWHGGDRYRRGGSDTRPLREPPRAARAIAGHYRSHNPWTTNFRVVLRGDQPWLVFASAPDGFEDEQPLVAAGDGSFRVGLDPKNPETLRFDTELDGRAVRAWLSGWPYYRVEGG